MEQATIKERIENISEHIGDFVEAQKQLALTTAAIKGSEIASSILLGFFIFLFTIIFIFFGAISLGFWFSSMLESQTLGFLAAGLIFLTIGVLCIVLKKPLLNIFKNFVVKLIYDRSNHI